MSAPAVKRRYRWGSALFLACLAAWSVFIAYALLDALIETYLQPTGRDGQVGFTVALTILGFPFALVICLLIGGPALLAAELLKLTRWWQAALIGGVGGLLAPLLVSAVLGVSGAFPFAIGTIVGFALFAIAGACAGVTAWASLWLDGKYRREALKAEV